MSIELTPTQVRHIEQARAEYARLMALHAQPLAQVDAAYRGMIETFGKVLEAHGEKVNGETWEIEEDGDVVRLVKREPDA